MISTQHLNFDRIELLERFLINHGVSELSRSLLADDCSFRRYFRLSGNEKRFVVMDAPPDKEDAESFVKVSHLLNKLGYSAPRIFGADISNGFLLLDDFGDATYTKALANGYDERKLYELAVDLLVDLHRQPVTKLQIIIPSYSEQKLIDEAVIFIDWYLIKGLKIEVPDQIRSGFIEAWKKCLGIIREEPDRLVLRDFHVDNLMVLEERKGLRACGILDFQDAVLGPGSYDLVSLLQDSRRDIPKELVDQMLGRYICGIGTGFNEELFLRSFWTLGTQRALKVFGIFTRQSLLYGNHDYLCHIPRLWNYTIDNLERPYLMEIRDWIDEIVPPELRNLPIDHKGI